MPDEITLRPIAADDAELLCRVYGSTRIDELAQTDWSDEQKEAFVRMQFTAQHAYYREHYAEAEFSVVLRDGQPAGRLYVARWPEEIRIVDITFLPEHRGAGLGSRLLAGLLEEARQRPEGRVVSIHVERQNPALELYRRLGFREVADKGVYLLLEWEPETAPESRPTDRMGSAS
jgi:ribosomal protein S18 acetylase RimI-like enzyme